MENISGPKTEEEMVMAAQASEAVNEAYNRLIVKNQEPELREYYEAREMWIIDQAIRESEARKEGREEGRVEGRQEGREETFRKVVTRMNESGSSIEYIASMTGLSPEEVKNILE